MTGLERALWVYPWDLVDEGISIALDRMTERAGATMVNVATVYHAGKFLHPHNPERKVVFPESGTLYFSPNPARQLRIQVPVWPPSQEGEFWERLRDEADARQLELSAWVLCLHNSGIGNRYPDCTVENAYGDRIMTDLCPRHPDVRDFLVTVVDDIATNLPVDRILLESLEYMPFLHGYHHEVVGVPTGPAVNFLMSLCFCSHCESATEGRGADGAQVRRWVRSVLDRHFENPFGKASTVDWEELRSEVDGAMGVFLGARREALTSLLEEVAGRVRDRSPARLALCDFGPLYPNGADGRGWENGVDLASQLPLVDEIHPTFYFTDLDVHARKVDEYLDVLQGERPMYPAIRAILPQTASFEDLSAQLEPLAQHAAGFSFYNYGFMALQVLDWIGQSVDQLERG